MVAIFTGAGLGLERSSGLVLGSRGQLGNAGLGAAGENVFVNAATGNLVITNTDEFLVGLGPDIAISRTYNSLGTVDGDNNDGWRPGVYRHVGALTGNYNSAGSTITRTDWDGSQIVYAYDAGRQLYVSTGGAGAYDTLKYEGLGGGWVWTDGDSRISERYDAQTGRLTSSWDVDGNTVSYVYDSQTGFIRYVLNSEGEFVEFKYQSNLLESIDYGIRDVGSFSRTSYTYDGLNRLSSITVDHSPNDSTNDGNAYTTIYTYDGSSKRVASISQDDGSHLAIAYVQVGTDYRVHTLTQTVAAGVTRVTGFSYDAGAGTTTITDHLGQTTTLTYDADNQLTQISSAGAFAGDTPQVTNFTYNANGDVTSATDGAGKVTSYAYDSHGNLVRVQDAVGNVIERAFSPDDRLLTETRYLVPDPDGAGAGTASGAVTTRYVYDDKLHLRFVVTPEGDVTEYRYDIFGRRISTIHYPANAYGVDGLASDDDLPIAAMTAWVDAIQNKSNVLRTDTVYDFRGNVRLVTSYSVALPTGDGDPTYAFNQVFYEYDQHGRLQSRHTNASDRKEVFAYDGLGRLMFAVDMAGAATTYAHDDAGGATTVTFANGLVRTSTYNKAGELISVQVSGGDIATADTNYRYDGLGRLRITTDPLGRKTHYLYDRLGRKIAEIRDISATGTGFEAALVEYVYDAADRLITTISYANGLNSTQLASLTDVGGDPIDVPLSSLRPTADDDRDSYVWRIYDDADRLIATVDAAGVAMSFAYDGLSRLVSTTAYYNYVSAAVVDGFRSSPPTSFTPPLTDARDRVTRNFYDDDGQLIGTLDSSGALTQFAYDRAGQKVREIGYARKVAEGLRASGTFAQLIASAGMSATDRRIDYVHDGRGLLRYVIDATGRPTEYIYNYDGSLRRTVEYVVLLTRAAQYTYEDVVIQLQGVGEDGIPDPGDDGSGGPAPLPDDRDGDGVLDWMDYDIDGDGVVNSIDGDIDGDTYVNSGDNDMDGDGILNASDPTPRGEPDLDGDGTPDASDNDLDGDGLNNGQDADADGDWLLDASEDPDGGTNASLGVEDYGSPSPTPLDTDGDGVVDSKDYDLDGDGIANHLDNDIDGDGIANSSNHLGWLGILDPGNWGDPDFWQGFNGDQDIDGDGIPNEQDELPTGQPDFDGDGIADYRDSDLDGDGISNSQDADADADGLVDTVNDPDQGSGTSLGLGPPSGAPPTGPLGDLDGDGVINRKDNDLDGDGIPNASDPDLDGDGLFNTEDLDADDDGIPNEHDVSPLGESDIDGDGILDPVDEDRDGDGTPNVGFVLFGIDRRRRPWRGTGRHRASTAGFFGRHPHHRRRAGAPL